MRQESQLGPGGLKVSLSVMQEGDWCLSRKATGYQQRLRRREVTVLDEFSLTFPLAVMLRMDWSLHGRELGRGYHRCWWCG